MSRSKELSKISGISVSGLHRIRHTDMAIQEKTIKRLSKVLECDPMEIRAWTPVRMPPPRKNIEPDFSRSTTLCWGCQNAVPDETGKRGCSWSRKLVPVEGWTAKESFVFRFDGGKRRKITSAMVIECPKFKPDPKPEEHEEKEPADPGPFNGTIHFEDEADLWSMLMSEWGI